MLISSNMCSTYISSPCILTQRFGTETKLLRKNSAQILSWRIRSKSWRSHLHEIIDPNCSAPRLLDPATCLNFQQRDQTVYFLDSAILTYDLQKFLRGKTHRALREKFITLISLRVMSLSVGCKEATNQSLQMAQSICRNKAIKQSLSRDNGASQWWWVPWLSNLFSVDFTRWTGFWKKLSN